MDVHDIHFDPIKSLLASNSLTLNMPMLALTAPNPLTQMTKPTTGNEPKRRLTKWGADHERVFQPPPFPGVPRNLPLEELEYLMRLYRLDELLKKKNLGQIELHDLEAR